MDENDDFGPRSIEDSEHVDERRAMVGLGSLAEYEEDMRKTYGL